MYVTQSETTQADEAGLTMSGVGPDTFQTLRRFDAFRLASPCQRSISTAWAYKRRAGPHALERVASPQLH